MTPDGFHREMVAWLIGQGLVLVSLVAGLVRWLLSREEERILGKMQSTVNEGFTRHNGDATAHAQLVQCWEDRRDRRLDSVLLHVGDSLAGKLKDAMIETMTKHNADPHAHPEGVTSRINPVLEEVRALRRDISALHDVVLTHVAQERGGGGQA